MVASLCLLAAVMSKSGQFILHTWLPDAMAGPTPVSALIHAATMVVAGIYMVARLYPVFWEGMSIGGSSINVLALVGAVTLLFGGMLAFTQNDIKKVLAYSTVSQLGYMVMALGVGAWTAAMFHLFTHAFFKACLFLGSGSVSHAVHSFDMKTDMGGLRKVMPHTYRTFLVATIALMGLPPLAGFWSKDEILAGTGGWGLFGGTHGNGSYVLMLVMGMAGAAVTAAYMTRVVYLTFFGTYRGHGHPHESGPRILGPLYVLAFFAVVAGLFNMPKGFQLWPEAWQERFGHYVEPVAAYFPAIGHAKPSWSLAIVATLVALAGAGLAWRYYFKGVQSRSEAAAEPLTEIGDGPVSRGGLPKAVHTALVNKYYFDHLYTGVIVKAVKGPLAKAAYWSQPAHHRRRRQRGGPAVGGRGPGRVRPRRPGLDRQCHRRRLGPGLRRRRRGPADHADRQGPAVRRHPVRGRHRARRRVHPRAVDMTPFDADRADPATPRADPLGDDRADPATPAESRSG